MGYRRIIDVDFVDYNEEALDKSWKWLNDPEIKHLTITPDFDRESQRKWFDRLKERDDYYIKALSVKGNIVGACGLKNINGIDGEVWVYIGEKSMWGKTIGALVIEHILEYANNVKLESIYLRCLKTNIGVRKIALRYGFKLENEINENDITMRLKL